MFIAVDYLKCTGCQRCETICSYVNTGAIGKSLSRIIIHKNEEKGIFIPVVCRHCVKPKCIEVCPTKALEKDEKTGTVKLDKSKCIGCRLCVEKCPFGCIGFDGEFPFKCELCNGDPECIKGCPVGALQLKKETDISNESSKKIRIEEFARALRE